MGNSLIPNWQKTISTPSEFFSSEGIALITDRGKGVAKYILCQKFKLIHSPHCSSAYRSDNKPLSLLQACVVIVALLENTYT